MTRPIPAGLRALLADLVDYAGLFPPAKLDMAATTANFASYSAGDDAWALGRLIVPAARLDEFEQHAATHLPTDGAAEPWPLSCLVAPAGSVELDGDLDRIAVFNDRHAGPSAGLAEIAVIELRGPSTAAVDDALDRIPDRLFPFFEIAVAEDPRGVIAAIAGSDAGAKVRTGGVEAAAYPAPEHLARFIAGCAAAGVPFKATAGLHHPLRHFSEAVGTDEFGFLNVFTAAVLARSGLRDEDRLAEVLVERSPAAFEFTDDGLGYGDRVAGLDAIRNCRRDFAVSFGSCSFTEPLDDLRSLNLIAATSP